MSVRVSIRRMPVRRGSAAFLSHATSVARSYGFSPARTLDPRPQSFNAAKVAALAAAQKQTEPTLVYYASASPLHIPAEIKEGARVPEIGEFGMVVVGSEESLAEVVLLRALTTIVNEWGLPLLRVRLNAMGDRDSKLRFGRELSGYLRKHYETLDDDCRRRASQDPVATYSCERDECRSILSCGPRAMNFLSEKSRAHFREVLEHIENLSLPYELDDLLMGDERESRLLFTLDTERAPGELVLSASGGRYDEPLRKQGKTLCAASILFRKGAAGATLFSQSKKETPPKVYFVQLGLRAKLGGLVVVDMLRRAGVPLLQSFNTTSLAPQIAAAKAAGTPHLIIMGAREALDNTVIIRALDNSTQEIIPIKDLPRALKSLR